MLSQRSVTIPPGAITFICDFAELRGVQLFRLDGTVKGLLLANLCATYHVVFPFQIMCYQSCVHSLQPLPPFRIWTRSHAIHYTHSHPLYRPFVAFYFMHTLIYTMSGWTNYKAGSDQSCYASMLALCLVCFLYHDRACTTISSSWVPGSHCRD
jgi:hypothetical protein